MLYYRSIVIISIIFINTLGYADNTLRSRRGILFGRSPVASVLNLSPNDINNLLEETDTEKPSLFPRTPLSPFFDYAHTMSELLANEAGIDIGTAYTQLSQQIQQDSPVKNATAGDFDIFGRLKNTAIGSASSLGFHLEARKKTTRIPPSQLNNAIDLTINTTSGFNDYNPALVELWWEKQINEQLGFRLGKIDISSMMNNYAYQSQNFYFLNEVFSGHPGWDEPSNSLGAVFGVAWTKHLYSIFGLVDACGDRVRSGFNTFGKGKYFTSVEIGLRKVILDTKDDNYHIMIWHSDAKPYAGILSDEGISVTLQTNFNDKVVPFFRAEVNQGRATVYKNLVFTGMGINQPWKVSYGFVGVAVSYGRPSNILQGNEIVAETFYRIQVAPYFQLTPDIQVIRHRPENQQQQYDVVGSLRVRLSA